MPRTFNLAARPFVALVSALAVVVAGLGAMPASAADGDSVTFDVSTMDPGEYTTDTTVDAFTVHATDAKPVVVDAQDRTGDGGRLQFTQRLKLGGAGNADYRSVEFTTTGESYLTAYALSSSSGSDRELALYKADGSEVARVPAYGAPKDVPPGIIPIDGAGTYYVASPSSGVNIFYLEVTEGPAPARAAWSDVQDPVITDVSIDGGDVVVDYDGVVGWDGADVATATLYDDAGNEVTSGISGTPSDSGTISLTPDASGDYEVQVALSRDGESTTKLSAREPVTGFVLPLAMPEINSALTTAVSGGEATVTIGWTEVPEAESYDVAYREAGTTEWTAGPTTSDLAADVPGLTPGTDYEVQVTAVRGDDSATSDPYTITPADAVERWQNAHAGVSSGGTLTELSDGSLQFDVRDNNGKLADSEDGFLYHYTEIDPDTENFTLSATFTVDDAENKDNQSGFGIVAVDTFVPNDRSARYFNSAGAMTAKYVREVDGSLDVRYGTPGGKYVTGYTDGPTVSSPERDMSRSQPFDWDYRSDWTEGGTINPPRFQTGDVYDYALRKSNTGFHAMWKEHGDTEWQEIIDYDPDLLLQQTSDSYYVGLFAARKIEVTASDIDFTTIDPADDEAPEPRPTTYVDPTVNSDVTRTTPHNQLDVPVVSNVYGKIAIRDSDGDNLGKVRVAPDERKEIPVSLQDGTNDLTLELKPDNRNKQTQLGDYEDLSSYRTLSKDLTIEVARYGHPGEAIQVAPDGGADGDGTPEHPLDLHTAVAFAQPGQQVVLEPGTYRPTRALNIDRGNDGTEDEPITLMSSPEGRATLDLSESSSGGIKLRGDHWHLYDLEITKSQGNEKPLIVSGNHNVIERIETHHNGDTGLQISLPPNANHEPREMWPTDNLVLSTVSHDNADPLMNDADGFAAKLTVGKGNVFRYCISYSNIDDGWDLYAKSTTGSTGPVRIEDSVVYHNGWLQSDPETFGEGNGFKLGGESMPGAHVLSNSVSFENHAKGITSNSGPDVRIHDVTSYHSGDSNLYLATSAESTDYEATGVLSYLPGAPDKVELRNQEDNVTTDSSNHLDGQGVEESWFESLDTSVAPEIADDGSIDMHGLLELTDDAPADTGARLVPNPSPTSIELLPPVSAE